MTREQLIKHKQIQMHKYKYAYNRVRNKLSSQGRFLANKVNQLKMEIGEMYSQ